MSSDQSFDFTRKSVSPVLEGPMGDAAFMSLRTRYTFSVFYGQPAAIGHARDFVKMYEKNREEIARRTSISSERIKRIFYPETAADKMTVSEFGRIHQALEAMEQEHRGPAPQEFDYAAYFKNFREEKGWTAPYAASYWGVSPLDYFTFFEPVPLKNLPRAKKQSPEKNKLPIDMDFVDSLIRKWQDRERRDADEADHMIKAIAGQIKTNREKQGLSVEALAEKAGVSAKLIENLEQGIIAPNLKLGALAKIGHGLGLALEASFGSYGTLARDMYALETNPASVLELTPYDQDPILHPWLPPGPMTDNVSDMARQGQAALYELLRQKSPDPAQFLALIGEDSPLGPDASEKLMLGALEWNLAGEQRMHFTHQIARAVETLDASAFWNDEQMFLKERLLEFAGFFSKCADSRHALGPILEAGRDVLGNGGAVNAGLATQFAGVCIANRIVSVDPGDPFHGHFMNAMKHEEPEPAQP